MRHSGLTLIELLVIAAVIGTLIGILGPALCAARQQSIIIVCGSNLKQLTLGLTMYEQENGGFSYGFQDSTDVRPPGDCPGKATRDLQGWWWFHLLADILEEDFGEGTILWCPSRNVNNPYILCGNYGVNRAICKDHPNPITGNLSGEFVGKSLALNQIRHPARTLLIVDSGYSLISWRGATDANIQPFENRRRAGSFYVPGLWINKERIFSPANEDDAINGRHPNKSVNVGFVDGHVSCVRADDLFVEETNGDYNNRTPLWLP